MGDSYRLEEGPVAFPRWWRAAPSIISLLLVIPSFCSAAGFLNYLNDPTVQVPVVGPLPDDQPFGSDLNAVYQQFYMLDQPGREILIVGEFPRSRYFSITVYDDHAAIIDTLYDAQIEPLNPAEGNPFRAGGPAGAEDILYAVRVRVGPNLVASQTQECAINTANLMEGRFRHTARSYYSPAQSQYTTSAGLTHADGQNTKGIHVVSRRYLDDPDTYHGSFDLRVPRVFVRDTANGCPLAVNPATWYTKKDALTGAQIAGHVRHEKEDLPSFSPDGNDPGNYFRWMGNQEYVITACVGCGYMATPFVPATKPSALNAAGRVLRLRFRLPPMPCRDPVCHLGEGEELRYWGLSLLAGPFGDRTTVATIDDADVHPDPDGYVDLIVSFGVQLPSYVKASNGYSVVHLPPSDLTAAVVRMVLEDFPYGTGAIPFKTNEHTSWGGYMGDYAPYATIPIAANLPSKANRAK